MPPRPVAIFLVGAAIAAVTACSNASEDVALEPAPTTTEAAVEVEVTTTAPPATLPEPLNIYRFTTSDKVEERLLDIPPRVYVPNSDEHTVSIIDPVTLTVIAKYDTGQVPHHVAPSWDMTTLYILDTSGNTLRPIDPRTSKLGTAIPVPDPYNLYFTPDGKLALVIAERYMRIDVRDPKTWELKYSVPIPHSGVNHGDFSADGRYFYATCEWSGWFVKLDLVEGRVVAERKIGQLPIDVKLAPDASVLYVADQGRNGVIVVDPATLAEVAFIPAGRGTHGLYVSRDGRQLYATNRLGGSVSVIDFATRAVVATWTIPNGGSPDMGSVSPDGRQFWVSGRNHGEIYVIDTTTGGLVKRIKTGAGPHGLTYFPQPGRYSTGHTGNYR